MGKAKSKLTKLKDLRKQEIKKSHDFILEDNEEESQASIKRVELLDRLLKEQDSKKPAALIVMCIIIVLAVAWAIKIPRTTFQATIETTAVDFVLKAPWSSDFSFTASELIAHDLKNIHGPLLPSEFNISDGIEFRAKGDMITLEPKYVAEDTRVLLRNDKLLSRLYLFEEASQENSDFMIKLQNGEAMINTILVQNPSDFPESFEVQTNSEISKRNTLFELYGSGPIDIDQLEIASISFNITEDYSKKKISMVRSGQIKIFQTNNEQSINFGDYVELHDLESRRISIQTKGNVYQVLIEGIAGSIKVGPKGFQKELKPSVLEWSANNPTIKMLSTAAVTLWFFFLYLNKSVFNR